MAERLDALTVRESNGKSYWTKIGAAFPNKNGQGYIVRLDAMPASVEGQFSIHLRVPLPKDGDRSNQGSQSQSGNQGSSYGGNSNSQADLDDSEVPF